jgi:hypothetical protein
MLKHMPAKTTTRVLCRWITRKSNAIDTIVRMFLRQPRHSSRIGYLGYTIWYCSEVQKYHSAEYVPDHELSRIGRIIAIKYNCLEHFL